MGISQLNENIRRIILCNTVKEETAASFLEQLTAFEIIDMKTPVIVYVSTFGGCLDSALMIYDAMKTCICPIHTIGIGKVMSAGVLILSAGDRGCRYITQNTRIMIHEITGGAAGSMSDVDATIKEMNRMQNVYVEILAKNTGQKREKILKDMQDTVYLSSAQAVDYGIVDVLLNEKKISKVRSRKKKQG